MIFECLRRHYGLTITSLTLLPLGADMHASVYKADTSEASYFVKLKRKAHDDLSATLLTLLHNGGIKEVIPPIKTIEGQLFQQMDDCTITVYPFIDGENGFCFSLTDEQWITLGKVLRKLHEFPLPAPIRDRIRKETYSPQRHEIVMEAKVSDEAALKLQAFMKEHMTIIQRLVDRAQYLRQKAQEFSPPLVLCHSDIHGGNVLIDKKGALYIVDWDDPILAPKERDLMFIGAGVANVWNQPHEQKFFYKGYGKTEINPVLLAYYRFERIVQDIAEYGQALLLETGGKNRGEMYQHFVDMFEPNGVVDIAFKSY